MPSPADARAEKAMLTRNRPGFIIWHCDTNARITTGIMVITSP